MARYPKKPKLKSLPKRPKASSSLATWENYKRRVEQVRKDNAQALKDWEKRKKEIDQALRKKETIQKQTQGVGRI